MDEQISFAGFQGNLALGLARRELETLLAVATGMTDKQAAQAFGLSPRTVKGAVERCMHKLQVYKRTALVTEAFRRGIIAPALCMVLALLVGLEHQQSTFNRRPEGPRRAEMRVASGRSAQEWAA